MGKAGKSFAIGAALAAAAGYVAGVLTAPKSGRETRLDLREYAAGTIPEAERQLKKLHTQLAGLLDNAEAAANTAKGKARTELETAIAAARTAREKAREALSAAHEGDAQPADLKHIIGEATKTAARLKAHLTPKPAASTKAGK